MKYKTLLLGTAAVFALAGSARAADLAVAESVEYVKVCDAYGAGYFYIPGSDTCLKISGDIQFNAFYQSNQAQRGESAGNIAPDDDVNWYYRTRAEVELTAKSMTDWGMLTSFVNIRDNRVLGAHTGFYAETAWAKIGGFKVGWDASTFDAGFLGADDEYPSNFDHDQHQGQIQWSTTAGGWGFFLAVEDPNDNGSGIHGSPTGIFNGTVTEDSPELPGVPGAQDNEWKGGWPDIVAAVTGGGGSFHWKGSLAATDTQVGTGFGGMLWGQWLQGGNSVTLQAAASNGAGALYGANIQPNGYGSGTYWHVAGQVGFAVTSAFTLLFEGGYQATPGPNAWEATAEADWTIGKGAVIAVEADYLSKDLTNDVNKSSTSVNMMFKRSFAQ